MEWNNSWSIQCILLNKILQTAYDNRIYSLSITTGPQYPQKAPEVKFINKINIPSVNQNNGKVENLAVLKDWKNEYTIQKILIAIKNEMIANKGNKQPAEGATY